MEWQCSLFPAFWTKLCNIRTPNGAPVHLRKYSQPVFHWQSLLYSEQHTLYFTLAISIISLSTYFLYSFKRTLVWSYHDLCIRNLATPCPFKEHEITRCNYHHIHLPMSLADELLESTAASTPVLANSWSVCSKPKQSLLQQFGYTYYTKHTDIVHTHCKIVKTVRCVGWLGSEYILLNGHKNVV